MSIPDFIQKPPATEPSGYWFPVLFCPEPATGERITVGIALRRPFGDFKFRWLKTYDRLRRVFGEQSAKHLPFLIRHAEAILARGERPETPHLHLGDARALWAADVESALDGLFSRFVPLSRDFDGPEKGHVAVQNRRLRETVFRHLKLSNDPRAAGLIAQNPMLRSSLPDEPVRFLEVPIQGTGRFGTIVSTHARNVKTIDQNVFPAVAQLNAAARIHRVKTTAIFLLRPDEKQFTEKEYDEIDGHFHQMMFVLKGEGVTVFPEVSPELIAQSIEDWGLQ